MLHFGRYTSLSTWTEAVANVTCGTALGFLAHQFANAPRCWVAFRFALLCFLCSAPGEICWTKYTQSLCFVDWNKRGRESEREKA